jgi:hypothetical protein
MGRTNKIGLDYFPLNIDMDEEDERVFMMENAFEGERAFGMLIKLLMVIYRNGYYYLWTEKEQNFFSKKKNIDLNYCKMVVNFLAKEGFFDRELFEKYHILTSRGIQKRYFEIVKRRDKVIVIKQFLLLNNSCIHDVDRNHIYVDINTIDVNINGVDVNINRIDVDKKGKERKGSKGSKEKEIPTKAAPPTASPPEVISPPQKTKKHTNPKDKQLADLAELLRVEDPAEYKKLLEAHPELAAEEVPW